MCTKIQFSTIKMSDLLMIKTMLCFSVKIENWPYESTELLS